MENVNQIFGEFAALFAGTLKDPEGEIVQPRRLDRRALDYSVDSLKAVDAYLSHLHRMGPESLDGEWILTVLRAGAYVGEVIRRSATRAYDWVDFDEYVKHRPDHKQMLGDEADLTTRALLVDDDGFLLPLNKVIKFIFEGEGESTWYLARVALDTND